MITNTALTKLSQITLALHQQAQQLDTYLAKDKAYQWRKEHDLFAEGLFSTHSEKLVDYVEEIQAGIIKLTHLLKLNKSDIAHHQLTRIERQIAAVINTVEAKNNLNKTESIRRNTVNAKKYQQAARQLFQPIQDLYKKLSEILEFERRLIEMLKEKESLLNTAPPSQKEQAANAVLIMHQRLGRCRQAISKLERQIEQQEKR
ncbi:primosomal replication protein PriC [Thalassotalea ganghwensis]